jgi:hypothetical protein
MQFCQGFRLCLSHLIYTVWPCLIHTYHAVPLPCHEYAFLKASSQGRGRVMAWERHGMCKLVSASRDGMLRTCQSSAYSCYHAEFQEVLSETYRSQMQVASVKQSNVCHGQGEAYYFGART